MSPAIAALFVLFNGQNLDGWKTLSGEWAVENNAIVCKAPGTIRSTFESDEYTLSLEHRHSQGAWIRMHYGSQEASVNFRLNRPGMRREGSPTDPQDDPEEWIRDEIEVRIHQVRVNRCRPDGSKNLIAEWPNRQGYARGFIALSADQPGLQIRNMKVTEPGFQSLFDGKTTRGWEPVGRHDPDNPTWYVEHGTLICRHTKWGNWLRTVESYDNFVLRLEYWLPKRGNSGIYLHAPATSERISQIGQEIQLIDDSNYPKLKPSQRAGAVYAGIAPEVNVPAAAEEWNSIEVFFQGKRIRTTLNGVRLYDARLDDASKDAQLLKNPLATRRLTGFIGLQDHTESPRFRNIRIRTLPPDSRPAG